MAYELIRGLIIGAKGGDKKVFTIQGRTLDPLDKGGVLTLLGFFYFTVWTKVE